MTQSSDPTPPPPGAGPPSPGGSGPPAGEAPAARVSEDGPQLEERVRALERELADVFWRLYRERESATGLEGRATSASLRLALELRRRPNGSSSDELVDQLRRAAEDLADRSAVFPAGHLYCYWCGSFRCAHSRPPEARTIFSGYSPTGQPSWQEFTSVLLERGDPRVDLLFRQGGATLPLTQTGGELASRQLRVYGKRSPIYRILGQVSLGYLRPPRKSSSPASPRDPFAVSFQAVEAAGGSTPAHLNIVGRTAEGLPAAQALEEFYDPRILDAVQNARRRFGDLDARAGSRRAARRKQRQVLEILRLLSKNLDRIFRQRGRRTRHSQNRHRDRERPASVALRDALEAEEESLLRDVEEHTWVVLGPKNRVHFFNDGALHVTSVVYRGETIRQRQSRGKWSRPHPEQAARFREALRSRAAPAE